MKYGIVKYSIVRYGIVKYSIVKYSTVEYRIQIPGFWFRVLAVGFRASDPFWFPALSFGVPPQTLNPKTLHPKSKSLNPKP